METIKIPVAARKNARICDKSAKYCIWM